MKNLLITLTILFASQSVFAASTVKLTNDDVAISNIQNAKVLSAKMFMNPNCPINALCMPATQVRIEFALNGCVDKLGPVSTKVSYNEVSGKYDIFVASTNISNKRSMVVRCIKAPTAIFKMNMRPFLETEDLNLILLK